MTILHEVFSIKHTQEPDVYILDMEITDLSGERYRCEYVSRPNDTFSPIAIRNWIDENIDTVDILPYVPPTIEEIRAGFPPLTSRQFWRAAASIDVSKEDVILALDSSNLPDKEEAKIEVMESAQFERSNPYIDSIALVLGISLEQLDSLWLWASEL